MDLPPESSESLSLSLEKENVQPEVTRWPDWVIFGSSMSCSFSFPSFLFFLLLLLLVSFPSLHREGKPGRFNPCVGDRDIEIWSGAYEPLWHY